MHRRVAKDPATDISKFETVGSLVRSACSNLSSCCTHCNNLCEAEGERHSQSWLALQPHQLVLQASWHHRNWPTRLHNAGTTNHFVQQVPVEEQLAMCGIAAGRNRRYTISFAASVNILRPLTKSSCSLQTQHPAPPA